MTLQSPLLTAEEAAEYLRLVKPGAKNPGRSMREFARRHKIKAVRIRKSPHYKPKDLDAFVEKQRW